MPNIRRLSQASSCLAVLLLVLVRAAPAAQAEEAVATTALNVRPGPAAPAVTNICARTGAGRTSQLRVNGMDGTTLKLGYTTWAN